MTDSNASITIAGRTLPLPLEQLHQILGGAELANSEALFTQAKLRRRTIAALRVTHPARYRDLRLGGGSYWLGIGHLNSRSGCLELVKSHNIHPRPG